MSHPSDIKYAREHRLAELMNSMVRHLLVYKPPAERVPDALINFLVLSEEEKRREKEVQRRERQVRAEKSALHATKHRERDRPYPSPSPTAQQQSQSRSRTQGKDSSAPLQGGKKWEPRPDPWRRGAAGLHRRGKDQSTRQPFQVPDSEYVTPARSKKKLPPLREPSAEETQAAVQIQKMQRGRAARTAVAHERDQQRSPSPSAGVFPLAFHATVFGTKGLPAVERVDYSLLVTVNGKVHQQVPITEETDGDWISVFHVERVHPKAAVNLQLWNCRVDGGRLCELLGEVKIPQPDGVPERSWHRLNYGREHEAEIEFCFVYAPPTEEAQMEAASLQCQAFLRQRLAFLEIEGRRNGETAKYPWMSTGKQEAIATIQGEYRHAAAKREVQRRKSSASSTKSQTRNREAATRRIQSAERRRQAKHDVEEHRAEKEHHKAEHAPSESKDSTKGEEQEARPVSASSARSTPREEAARRIQSAERRRRALEVVEERKHHHTDEEHHDAPDP